MPILAVCPYCREGKVRAPDHALGLSATCPRCYNCFTVVASPEPAAVAVTASPHLPTSVLTPAPSPDPATTAVRRPRSKPAPPPVVDESSPSGDVRRTPSAAGFYVVLIAFTFAGLALSASWLPSGGVIGVGLSLIGFFLALLGLLVGQRRVLAGGAVLFNLLVVVVILAMPGLLGLPDWSSPPLVDDSRQVKAISIDDATISSSEWVDVSKAAWQRDGVRVSIRAASVGKVDLIGPNKLTRRTDAKFLRLSIRVANEGASRAVEFHGWSGSATLPVAPRLSDSTGKALAAIKNFETNFHPDGQAQTTVLLPGKSAGDLLIFELPPRQVEYLRLELPGSAIGDVEPIKLHIPRSWIVEP